MRTMDKNAPMDLGHPLGPLGLWGPHPATVQREVHRKGRFKDWKDLESRLDAMLVGSIRDTVPTVLRDDLMGRTPRMLLRQLL